MAYHRPQGNTNMYSYPEHSSRCIQRMDENRNENNCRSKEVCSQMRKVDAATMTDPLQIDFGLNYPVEPQHITNIPLYQCPECPYRFNNRVTMQEHLEIHRQRPHICDICGASLKRKEHLDRHKQGHNKDRPYQCNMCCKAFKRNEHLARHMIIHSGSKNQICSECGKAFYRKDHLKKHFQSHSGNRNKNLSRSQNDQAGQSDIKEGLSNFAMLMKQAGPPSFSILRT